MDKRLIENIKDNNILVVDDNVVNQKVLSKVLESNGYKVSCASDGQEALDYINNYMPDLVLLDVQMPGINGFDVCRRIKANEKTEEIPVIFITASDTVESKVEGFKAGAVDYIPRPLQMPEVLARVSNQLTIQELKRNSEEEKDRLEKILAALPLPYFITRVEDGSFLDMNSKACSVFDVAYEDVKKYKSTDFYATPEIRAELVDIVLGQGLIANKEIELVTRTGRAFTSLFSATPLRLQNEDVLFVAFSDITERKEMELALEKAATTDYLTGILNRRAFTQRAEDERYRANRNNHPICLLMLDIDHFKKINDTYGHDIGDDALKVMVELIGRDLRLSDALGRLGGEEFALLLPETEFDGAKVLAERIRQCVEENEMVLADGTVLKMTVSGGLAVWEKDMPYDDAIKLVDDRLYAAKKGGRNKIEWS
jgi:two-component system, cell cycle response regulator